MDEHQDRWDQALDAALASYGEAPEREGLEHRVLAGVRERAAGASRLRRFVLIACVAAATVLCLLRWQASISPMRRQRVVPVFEQAARVEPSKAKRHSATPRRPAEWASARKRKPHRVPEPKLEQFPSPLPLGSEERALLRLATLHPESIPSEFTELGSPIEPIEVPALEVKPIE